MATILRAGWFPALFSTRAAICAAVALSTGLACKGRKLEKTPVNRAVISINFLIVRLLLCVLIYITVCKYSKNIISKAEDWDFFSIFAF